VFTARMLLWPTLRLNRFPRGPSGRAPGHLACPTDSETSMTKTTIRTAIFGLLALCLAPAAGTTPVRADGAVEIRMATIAPKASKAMRILRAWDMSVQEKTQGRVKFRFYAGGIAGDERDVLRKMKVSQIDATSLTSVGLGQIVRSASVLQVPGMFHSYKELAAVRSAMDAEWQKQFGDAGYRLLGWFDIGFGRIFSAQSIARPSDLKKARPWVWRDDPVFPELMKIVGANGVPLSLPEVFPALQTKMVDTVIASPTAALGLQWFNNVKYMTKQADIALVGATLLTNQVFHSLRPEDQEVLSETGKQAHQKALELISSEEQADYAALKARGIIEVDTAPYAAEWNKAYADLRGQLVGRLFSKELLERVSAAAASVRK
jgi:TRAP-type C4-dicarboxylate transport system substrate-binding protein